MIDAMIKHLITVAIAGVAAVVAACGGSRAGDDAAPRVTPLASVDGAASLQQELVSVVRAVSPSVVHIRTAQDLGSGVVFDARGDVVTNAHVVGNATRLVVTLASGDSHRAMAIARDAANDLAVIRIAGVRPRLATFADSSQVAVGDIALALGNPLDCARASPRASSRPCGAAFPRATASPSRRSSRPARRSTRNSGGALVDLSGRVIGIPTVAALDPQMGSSVAPGIGFAIDGNTVSRVGAALAHSR